MEIDRLRTFRLRRGLTQRNLAAASGVGVVTINRLERGLQLARPSTARRLAAALGVEVEALQAAAEVPIDALRLPPGMTLTEVLTTPRPEDV